MTTQSNNGKCIKCNKFKNNLLDHICSDNLLDHICSGCRSKLCKSTNCIIEKHDNHDYCYLHVKLCNVIGCSHTRLPEHNYCNSHKQKCKNKLCHRLSRSKYNIYCSFFCSQISSYILMIEHDNNNNKFNND